MGLSDIAAGVETTTRQRESGVAAVDATGESLTVRLEEFADDLPCGAGAAAALLERYVGGGSVGESARRAGLAPVTAAKTLHLLGVEGVCPLSPAARGILRDYLTGRIPRSEAAALLDAGEAEFALAAFVESHDPLPGASGAIEEFLSERGDAMVEKRDELGESIDDTAEHY